MYSVQIQVSCQISFNAKTLQFMCESEVLNWSCNKLEINTDKPETNNSKSAELPKQLPHC